MLKKHSVKFCRPIPGEYSQLIFATYLLTHLLENNIVHVKRVLTFLRRIFFAHVTLRTEEKKNLQLRRAN